MAQLEVTIEVTGMWRFKICIWLMRACIFSIKMVNLFLPRPSRNATKKKLFVEFAPTMKEAV